jgi:hypothetical protein
MELATTPKGEGEALLQRLAALPEAAAVREHNEGLLPSHLPTLVYIENPLWVNKFQ